VKLGDEVGRSINPELGWIFTNQQKNNFKYSIFAPSRCFKEKMAAIALFKQHSTPRLLPPLWPEGKLRHYFFFHFLSW